eukprot:TRINITY_DN10388_c0_g2_i1.p2 TRINITY_DN10388_c0_g2~~TRINITY_DN10388_c0_g2_i1.p2  ORF type:complete len:143 (+),score=4.23 TRINITY_DN10388_c0_g2_i1:377-805(+)
MGLEHCYDRGVGEKEVGVLGGKISPFEVLSAATEGVPVVGKRQDEADAVLSRFGDDEVEGAENFLVVDAGGALECAPAAVVEGPSAADGEALGRGILEDARDFRAGGVVGGEQHQPVRVETVHVERASVYRDLLAASFHEFP